MCTLTIRHESNAALVTMNRDEALSRGPELAPTLVTPDGGPAWIAPKDSDRGGTWMGVNARGIVACLLNAYLPGESLLPDPGSTLRSRGEIIPALLVEADAENAGEWLSDSLELNDYPSFTLAVVTQSGARCYWWLREKGLQIEEVERPWHLLTSSGWDSEDVKRWRAERFVSWRKAHCPMSGPLPHFHILQEAGDEERSPLMQRGWSETRSITQVEVDYVDSRARMRYWAQPRPDSRLPDDEQLLTIEQHGATQAS